MRTPASAAVTTLLASLTVLTSACSDVTQSLAPDTAPPAVPALSVVTVQQSGAATAFVSRLLTSQCVDVYGGVITQGATLVSWTCNGASNQVFSWQPSGEIRAGTLCVDAYTAAGRDGDPVVMWPCNGASNQKWTATAAGEIRGINGKCIDIYGVSKENGAKLVIWSCHGGLNQQWDERLVAPPAVTARAATVFELVGSAPTVATVEAQGGVFARYEQQFRSWSEQHWTLEGAAWDQANYYDRAMIYYVAWARTGNATYLARGHAMALDYRKNYVEANDFKITPHWAMLDGLALHYLLTGDEASRTAIGRIADSFATPYYLNNLNKTDQEMENRMQARVLSSFVLAKRLQAPTREGNDWAARSREALTKILATQSADGAYRFTYPGINQCGFNKPFMVGLLNDAMQRYTTLFERDARILPAIKKSIDYMWAADWRAEGQGFVYLGGVCPNGGDATAQPDLNMLLVSSFGYVYRETGDATYRTRGDAVFAGGVQGAWLNGSKQFNESYHHSFRYLGFRQ